MSSLKHDGECKLGDAYKNLLRTTVLLRPRYLRLSYKRLRGLREKGLKAEKEIAMMNLAR